MKKYLTIYKSLSITRLMQLAEYRANFLMINLASLGYNIVTLVFIEVLLDNFGNIAGWSRGEVIVLYGVGQATFYLYGMFIGALNDLSEDIRLANLDMLLLKPVNAIFMISLRRFELVTMTPVVVVSVAITIYGLNILGISLVKVLPLYIFGVIAGTLIMAGAKLVIGLGAFWLGDTHGIGRFYRHVSEKFYFPMDVYPEIVGFVFKTIIPIAALSYFPSQIILGRQPIIAAVYLVAGVLFFFLLSYVMWTKGVKRYASASS